MSKGMLIDTTMCVGCCMCEEACNEKNDLSNCEESELSACKFTKVYERGDQYVRKMCMHCEEPACASVCPVGALKKLDEGPVIYYEERCIGCRYCMQACPFQIPKYEWASAFPRVRKCWFCYDRVVAGKQPACAESCPTGATQFGERGELLVEARKRIAENPGQYQEHIFGEKEVGGTSMLFLAAVPFEQIGFKSNLIEKPLPLLTWNVLSKIPDFVLVGGTVLGGIAWVINRRILLQEERSSEEAEGRRFNGEPETKGGVFDRFRKKQ